MVRIEPNKRLIATTKDGFFKGQKVSLVISGRTEMGFVAVINGTHKGILYKSEIFQSLNIGQAIDGFIKKVRDDKKIDLCLQKPGYKSVDVVCRRMMDHLRQQGGFIAVTDKSRPKLIADLFGISKKSFKKAVGHLYKKRLIILEQNGIRLRDKGKKGPAQSHRVRGKGRTPVSRGQPPKKPRPSASL